MFLLSYSHTDSAMLGSIRTWKIGEINF
jgi:hypothetical protein